MVQKKGIRKGIIIGLGEKGEQKALQTVPIRIDEHISARRGSTEASRRRRHWRRVASQIPLRKGSRAPSENCDCLDMEDGSSSASQHRDQQSGWVSASQGILNSFFNLSTSSHSSLESSSCTKTTDESPINGRRKKL